MNHLQPIETLHLFVPLEAKLLELLKSLSPADWQRMALPQWTVKDVAAHLLDSSLRRLSIVRDGYSGEAFTGTSSSELVTFLNRLNADWVRAFRRISPQVLIVMLAEFSEELVNYLNSLDPNATAAFSVSWAGESTSANWFDIAREYTERCFHQQQIRDAVNRPGIMSRELYAPVLATFMRALPNVYRNVESPVGTTWRIEITGDAGGTWFLTRHSNWELSPDHSGQISARATIADKVAWKLFTKGLDQNGFEEHVKLEGDMALAGHLANALAVVA